MSRRESIGDSSLRTRSVTQRSLRIVTRNGSFRFGDGAVPAGGGIAGTVNFGVSYEAGSGKRVVIVQRVAGSSSAARVTPMHIPNIGTAHFTYRASGSGGTFMWVAHGSVAPGIYS